MLNKVQLIGRIGKDVEVRTFEGGNKIANTSIATSENYKDKAGEWKENTSWHNLTFWGRAVDYVETRIAKGMLVFIEGKIEYRKYEDKNGVKRTATNIRVNSFKVLERQGESAPVAAPPVAKSAPPVVQEADDDLPF